MIPLAAIGLSALLSTAAAPAPTAAARVAELVRQLAADDFDRREAAQAALVALGPGIIPELDAREPFGDPEVAARVRAVRRAVNGVAVDLREILEAHTALLPDAHTRRDASPKLLRLLRDHQPAAGDFLLTLTGDRRHPLHRAAVNAFVVNRGLMTPAHMRTYLEQSLAFQIGCRPAYPRGVDAMIRMGYEFDVGWDAWPRADRVLTAVAVTHTLDGKPAGKPYAGRDRPTDTTEWLRTKALAPGRHTLAMTVAFEGVHGGRPIRGEVRSPVRAFEVVGADAPDDLLGPTDAAAEKLLRESLWIGETLDGKYFDDVERTKPVAPPPGGWWKPQYTWLGGDGKRKGLHVPVWTLDKPLPFDLAFDVFLRVDGTQEEHRADTLVEVKGETKNLGHVFVADVRAAAKGRTGFVPVRVVLRPRRALALTEPRVTSYYGREFVSDVVRMKVGPGE